LSAAVSASPITLKHLAGKTSAAAWRPLAAAVKPFLKGHIDFN